MFNFATRKQMPITMRLKFEGQTHAIDANTLINALVHYQIVVNEANKQYGGGTRDVRLQVNAIKKALLLLTYQLFRML